MFQCDECGKKINLTNPEPGEIVDCPECGIELEFVGTSLTTLYLGLSEE